MLFPTFKSTSLTFPASFPREYPQCTQRPDDRLNICVKIHTPLNNPNPGKNDVSFILAHANGFCKELYEPFVDELLARLENLGLKVRNVWAMEFVNQGASGILNEGKLGEGCSWNDGARDIVVMIKHFDIAQPLIGIGHSMGGFQLFLASIQHPRLFAAMIGIDPVTGPPTSLSSFLERMTAKRRDVWSSREDTAKYCSSRQWGKNWDPRVLKLYLKYGLRDLPTATYPDKKGVTLTTTKYQEACTYKTAPPDGTVGCYEPHYVEVPLSKIQCPVFFLVGEKSIICPPETNHLKTEDTPRSELVMFKNAGHLIPLDLPSESAEMIAPFIEKCLKRYFAEREEDEKTTQDRHVNEKTYVLCPGPKL